MDTKAKKQLERFFISSQIFSFNTSKIHHHDRDGYVTRYFFHFYAMTSSLAKVMGLQSRLLLEKKAI